MSKPKFTQQRIILAFAIAVIADILQFPVTAITATGLLSIPGEFVDIVLDFIVLGATSMLLGFHWVLLPSLFVEVIPGLDLLPTWTGCVAFVVWQRRKEQRPTAIVDSHHIGTIRTVTEVAVSKPPLIPVPAGSPPATAPVSPVEGRLNRLAELHRNGLITDQEYQAKRSGILDQI